MPGVDAFFDPAPRLELMRKWASNECCCGIFRGAIEERLADDPNAACVAVHALNQWMYEHWTYSYEDATHNTDHLIAVLDAASRSSSTSPGTWPASSSPRRPGADLEGTPFVRVSGVRPFWKRVQELGLLVGMHAGDPGYTRFINEWEASAARRASATSGTPR